MNSDLDQKLIRRRLDKTVASYAAHSVVQQEVATRVLERLDYIKQTPKQILDMSLHGAESEALLRRRFPKANYSAAQPFMTGLQQRKKRWFQANKSICMPFDSIPLQTQSVDFIFMNLRLLWSSDWALLLRDCRRVLMPQGMLLFTSLGPDTLLELRQAGALVHDFIDLHDIGDVLVGAGFENPVMDMEKLVMQYSSLTSLTKDLRLTGCQFAQHNRRPGLMTPRQWQRVEQNYKKNDAGFYPATFEIIYGHAWAGERVPQKTTATGEILVSLQSLQRNR